MDVSNLRRQVDSTGAPIDNELRSFIEGESTADIVRQVTDAFAEDLAEIMKRAREARSSD